MGERLGTWESSEGGFLAPGSRTTGPEDHTLGCQVVQAEGPWCCAQMHLGPHTPIQHCASTDTGRPPCLPGTLILGSLPRRLDWASGRRPLGQTGSATAALWGPLALDWLPGPVGILLLIQFSHKMPTFTSTRKVPDLFALSEPDDVN